MKGVDETFRGAGTKPGLEIWCVENQRLVFVPKSSYGKFFSGSTYIVLNTVQLRSGLPQHDVHYWMGKESTEIDSAMVSDKALELDAALGSRTVQYREIQGCETEKFLSYFKPCVIPVEGVFSSGVGGSDGKSYRARLLKCKGEHAVHVSEVPFSRSSLNHNDVFILDTESKMFLFCGSDSSMQERAKALEVVQYIKDGSHGGRCEVATIESGKFVGDPDVGEFWSLFGGYAPITRDAPSNGKEQIKNSSAMLFWINKGKLCPVEAASLRRGMLNADKCYILDCGSEIFVWMGRNTLVSERKTSISSTEDTVRSQGRSTGTSITFLTEGFETANFKCYFEDWPRVVIPNLYEEGREKVAAIFKHQGYDVKELPEDICQPYMDCSGVLKVWRVDCNGISPIPAINQNKLYSGDCYVVQYTYSTNERSDHLFYAWLGCCSASDDRADAVSQMNSMAESVKGHFVMAQIFEGREPSQFFAIFHELICFKGGTSAGYKWSILDKGFADETYYEDKTALFRVQGLSPDNMQAIQVDLVSSSLNSSHCYILQGETFIFTWTGSLTSVNDHNLLSKMVDLINPLKQLISVREGNEPDAFWNAIGGKADYPREKEIKGHTEDPHLFSCVFSEDDLMVKEIFNFTQEDLTTEDVFILDSCTEIYIWVGKHANLLSIQECLSLGKKFLDTDILLEGLSLETAIYIIPEGNEPTFFTHFFHWDSSKINVHGNSFERKLAILNGFAPDMETPRSSLISSQRYTFEYATVRSQGKFFSPDGSPASSMSPSSELLKTHHLSPAMGTRQLFPGSPHSSNKISPDTQMRSSQLSDNSSQDLLGKRDQNGDVGKFRTITVEDEEGTEIDVGLKVYPYELLKVPSDMTAEDIDVTKREAYLSSEEFQRLFKMPKKAFYSLPEWRRNKLKMALNLF